MIIRLYFTSQSKRTLLCVRVRACACLGWTLTTWTTFLFSFLTLTPTSRAIGSNRKPSSTRFCITLHACFLFHLTLLIWIILSFRSKSFSPRCRKIIRHSSLWIHLMNCVLNVIYKCVLYTVFTTAWFSHKRCMIVIVNIVYSSLLMLVCPDTSCLWI